tara:strand:+ start:2070 stop:3443 length:1374 start_codon:yes stop_codon:yes gene_type:complete
VRGILVLIVVFLSFNVIGQDSFVLSKIEISGNKTTKKRIILREVSFSVQDTILFSDTAKYVSDAENNLLNTSLFNFTKVVFVDTLGMWVARIKLQERWYLWPQVVIKFQDRNFSEWWKTKNFSRIEYGLIVNRNNFLGLNQTLQGQFYYGFTKKIGFKYQIPYLTKNQRGGLKIGASYGTQNEIFSGVENNEMNYIKNDSDIIFNEFSALVEFTLRSGFYNLQTFAIEFKDLSSAHELNDNSVAYFGNTDGSLKYIALMYWCKIDKRFSKNYPLTGHFFDFRVRQFGLGSIDKSDLFVTRVTSNFRLYKHLKKRHFVAGGAYMNVFTQKDIPFRFQSGLGFHEYVRGYEPYVVFGQASFLAKTNYKFQLVAPKEFTLPLIRKWKKFSKAHFAMYWNIYSDFGYVHQKNSGNSLNNKLLWGVGTGFDWVSYYDMVIRTEVSINKDGLAGFYLNFVAPI